MRFSLVLNFAMTFSNEIPGRLLITFSLTFRHGPSVNVNNINLGGSEMTEKTLHEAIQEHLEYLKGQGKSERTLYTYNKDLE
jgi:hypothetical protein